MHFMHGIYILILNYIFTYQQVYLEIYTIIAHNQTF